MRGKKGISDKMRRDAILLCELAGSGSDRHLSITEARDATGSSDGASRVATDARWAVRDHPMLDVDSYADSCLEAAALLRDGWSPGDPVVRRGGGS